MTDRLETRTLACHPTDDGALIWLYIGEDVTRQSGQIIGHVVPAPKCCELTELAQAAGRPFTRACMVANAALIDTRLLNRGYGVQLYVDLATAATKQFDAPLVSSTVWGHEISPDAQRLWKSRRLAESLLVRGRSAWVRPEAAALVAALEAAEAGDSRAFVCPRCGAKDEDGCSHE